MRENKNTIKMNKMALACQSFYVASKTLIENKERDKTFSWYEIPCAVNCAFTSELAIKALLLYYNIKYEKLHYLDELLFALPQEECVNIVYYLWKNFYKNNDCKFVVDKILSISRYFIDARYISDYTQIINLYDIQSFMETVYNFFLNTCRIEVKLIESLNETSEDFKKIDKLILETEQKIIKERKNKLKKT